MEVTRVKITQAQEPTVEILTGTGSKRKTRWRKLGREGLGWGSA